LRRATGYRDKQLEFVPRRPDISELLERSFFVSDSDGDDPMLPPSLREFSPATVDKVTQRGRVVRWRGGFKSRLGCDIVAYMQERRAKAGLPALDEKIIYAALEAEEASVVRKKAAARAERATADMSGMTEVTA
jgi:hypothetical protein